MASIRSAVRLLSRMHTTNTQRASLPHRFHTSAINMGVTVDSISPGDGKNYPKPGDTVTMHCG